MNDVRDEALAAVLDRTATRIESDAADRFVEILRRGDRRRTVRFTAIGAAIGIFGGAVVWAGLTWPRDVARVPTMTEFRSSEVPWMFDYPSDWTTESEVVASPTLIANLTRTAVVNGPMPARIVGAAEDGSRPFTSELGARGVVVLVERIWGGAARVGPDENGGPDGSAADHENPGWTYEWRSQCEGTICYTLTVWWGPEASSSDRDTAEAILRSVKLAETGRWTESDGVHTTLHDEARGYTVIYPNSWTVADENLTPWLSSPAEILSLGTFPLRVSDHPGDGLRLFDAPVAPAALEDMRSSDAFVSVQGGGEALGDTRTRPEHFGPLSCDEAIYGCQPPAELPEPWRSLPFNAWWIPFEDAGRGFYLFVAVGDDASPEVRSQTWAIADSLAFVPLA